MVRYLHKGYSKIGLISGFLVFIQSIFGFTDAKFFVNLDLLYLRRTANRSTIKKSRGRFHPLLMHRPFNQINYRINYNIGLSLGLSSFKQIKQNVMSVII